ncbi:hypothetical protein AFLA_013089 [Aspergillus flavus NRRL3357]|nr:hypothetical protein AFLA_013089 [Aspergillus flavus NRRL3357]
MNERTDMQAILPTDSDWTLTVHRPFVISCRRESFPTSSDWNSRRERIGYEPVVGPKDSQLLSPSLLSPHLSVGWSRQRSTSARWAHHSCNAYFGQINENNNMSVDIGDPNKPRPLLQDL